MHYAKHIRQQFFVMVKPPCLMINPRSNIRWDGIPKIPRFPELRYFQVDDEEQLKALENGWPTWMGNGKKVYCHGYTVILVGGLEHFLFFHIYILGRIIPTVFHIFQRGRSTTKQNIKPSMFLGLSDLLGNSWFLTQTHHYHRYFFPARCMVLTHTQSRAVQPGWGRRDWRRKSQWRRESFSLSLIQGSTCSSCFFCYPYMWSICDHVKTYILSCVPVSSGIILPGIDIGVEGKMVKICQDTVANPIHDGGMTIPPLSTFIQWST